MIFKSVLSAFLIYAMTWSPVAWAARSKAQKPSPHLSLQKVLRASKGGITVSDFMDGAAPMVKRRFYKDMRKHAMPYMEETIKHLVIGKDYFKFKFKGHQVFGRLINKGPVAFKINNKTVLWNDLLHYHTAKAKLYKIISKQIPSKRISFLDQLTQLIPSAYAASNNQCDLGGGRTGYINEICKSANAYVGLNCCCECHNGDFVTNNKQVYSGQQITSVKGSKAKVSTVTSSQIGSSAKIRCNSAKKPPPVVKPEAEIPVLQPAEIKPKVDKPMNNCDTDPFAEDCPSTQAKGNSKLGMYVAIGIGVLALYLLFFKKKKKSQASVAPPPADDEDPKDEEEVPGMLWAADPLNSPCESPNPDKGLNCAGVGTSGSSATSSGPIL